MTNYEKIRNMSIEEMSGVLQCPSLNGAQIGKNGNCGNKDCNKCILEWLLKESEG